MYVKENTILHLDSQSSVVMKMFKITKMQKAKYYTWWTQKCWLLINSKSKQNSVFSKILERIKRSIWSHWLMVERPLKKCHKITREKGITCNGDIIVSPQALRNDILKCVHEDIHYSETAAQRTLKFQIWSARYSKEVDYIKRSTKCDEIKKKTINEPKFTHSPKDQWIRSNVDHALVKDMDLFLIFKATFSGWL